MEEQHSYRLQLSDFEVEFDINLEESLIFTQHFKRPEFPDFAFAVAEVWLRIETGRCLVISERETDNLMQLLNRMLDRVYSPTVIDGIEKLIPHGGLFEWMSGYWARIDQESVTQEDEQIYAVLDRAYAAVENECGIAMYLYAGKPTLEVSAQREDKSHFTKMVVFNPAELGRDLTQLRDAISRMIVQRVRLN